MQCAKSAWDQLDATFTKYLKSYLGIPKHSNNAIVHHLCETTPFSVYMKNRIQESISVLSYPKEFNGIKLSFLQDDVPTEECNNYERIPSWFWLGPTFEKMPINNDLNVLKYITYYYYKGSPKKEGLNQNVPVTKDVAHISLFVFSMVGSKQNAGSLLTPVSDTIFYTLSHDTLGFPLHGSFFNHFLIGPKVFNSQSDFLK